MQMKFRNNCKSKKLDQLSYKQTLLEVQSQDTEENISNSVAYF